MMCMAIVAFRGVGGLDRSCCCRLSLGLRLVGIERLFGQLELRVVSISGLKHVNLRQ